MLGCADRHRRGERLSVGGAGRASAGHLEHWWTETGFRCLDRPAGAVAVPARAGRDRRVLVPDAASHGAEGSAAVRKAYIVQYAPERGGEALPRMERARCRTIRRGSLCWGSLKPPWRALRLRRCRRRGGGRIPTVRATTI